MDGQVVQTVQPFWTSSLGSALITGTIVFVAQKMFDKSFLDPVIQYNQNLGRLKSKLSFYANRISNPLITQGASEISVNDFISYSDELRMMWSEMDASYMVLNRLLLFRIPRLGGALKRLMQIPNDEDFRTAMSCLIRVSNSMTVPNTESFAYHSVSNTKDVQTIITLLKMT
jgi:hypothetical protein